MLDLPGVLDISLIGVIRVVLKQRILAIQLMNLKQATASGVGDRVWTLEDSESGSRSSHQG